MALSFKAASTLWPSIVRRMRMALFSSEVSVVGWPVADDRGEPWDGDDAGAVSGVVVLHAVTASSSAAAGTA
ncbi:hypothetical protein GCM10009646_68200 [Streptomyces aureus]